MMLTIIKTVKAQVRGLPTRLEIFKIHLAIRGYRSLIHKIPSRPQKTEYVKQMRPLRFKGRLL